MTQQDGIIKSLQTLIKHEKAMQEQDSDINELKFSVSKVLETLCTHHEKMEMLCAANIFLANELHALRNHKFAQGVN
jgi:hypothetical protein